MNLRALLPMFVHRLLLLFISLCLLSLTGQAHAQSRAKLSEVDDRLIRVERVLDQSLLNLLQQIEGLQGEVRSLRGEVESLTNELETVKKRSRDLYKDTDRRVTDLEALGSSTALPDIAEELGEEPVETTDAIELDQPVFVAEQPAIPQPRVNSGANGPVPPATPIGTNTRAASAAEKDDYARAYDLLAKGNSNEAVQSFDKFLRDYPDGPLSDNAWYWQGEAKYANRNFDDALYNFSVVVEYFPSSPKVSDSRLKIGYSLYEQQRFDEAKQVLVAVTNDYPGRSAAVLARKRLQQMTRDGQ